MPHRIPSLLLALGALGVLSSVSAQCGSTCKSKTDAPVTSPSQPASILEIARADGRFGTLLAAIDAAGLGSALAGTGPFTVLAPTDAAFAALPEGTVSDLLREDSRDALRLLLTHHVIAGAVSARDAVVAGEAKTLAGTEIPFSLTDGRLRAGSAGGTGQDITAANGVIHVIDRVLIPERRTVALSDVAPTAPVATHQFPEARGSNLEGRAFHLPADLEGEPSIVILAFRRWQQEQVDTWMPHALELVEKHQGTAVYELPVLDSGWRLLSGWIDGGMRSGISDVSARERTITLYLDKHEFLAPLEIEDESVITVMLVNPSGEVLWRTTGPATDATVAELAAALDR
jgi:uncharacterized surface protein with fasciclin (FAS1) repeats